MPGSDWDTLTDALGVRHAPAETPVRIVSLVPSITELLFALGLETQIVGRTHYCIHPAPAVMALPSVGGTKKIKYSRLRALQPTHVIVNIDENPRELAERLASRHPTLKRLFMSGYSVDVIAHDGILDAGVHFLQKPFTISMLADQVRTALQSG